MRIDFEYWPTTWYKPRAVMLKVHRRNHDTLTIHIVNPPCAGNEPQPPPTDKAIPSSIVSKNMSSHFSGQVELKAWRQ